MKLILRKTPVIIKSCIHTAYERSIEYVKGHNYFLGKGCLRSLILFQQYFIQGRSYETAESFRQLDLSQEETERIMRKKKQKRITDLATLLSKEEEREFMLGLLEPNRANYMKECLEYYPKVELEAEFKVDD